VTSIRIILKKKKPVLVVKARAKTEKIQKTRGKKKFG